MLSLRGTFMYLGTLFLVVHPVSHLRPLAPSEIQNREPSGKAQQSLLRISSVRSYTKGNSPKDSLLGTCEPWGYSPPQSLRQRWAPPPGRGRSWSSEVGAMPRGGEQCCSSLMFSLTPKNEPNLPLKFPRVPHFSLGLVYRLITYVVEFGTHTKFLY